MKFVRKPGSAGLFSFLSSYCSARRAVRVSCVRIFTAAMWESGRKKFTGRRGELMPVVARAPF